MNVPFIDLKPFALLARTAVIDGWSDVVAQTAFVNGQRVSDLEQQLCNALDVGQTICCANGTDALIVALQALGVGPGSKVALPNLTFWATYEAIVHLGGTPVLLDTDAEHLQVALAELKRAHESHGLDAFVLVHLMGWASPECEAIRNFCREAGIDLLEDGAQAFGVRIATDEEPSGRSVFEGARIATLSFYPAKVIGGCMDGGAIFCNDEALAARVRKLCNHGRSAHFSYDEVGWNSRMSGLQAVWLKEMVAAAPDVLAARCRLEEKYHQQLGDLGGRLHWHRAPEGVRGNGYLAVCQLLEGNLDVFLAALRREGIGLGRVYPAGIAKQPPAKGALRSSKLEQSEAFCRRVFNLPLFFGMTDLQFETVKATVERCIEEA